MTVTGSLLTAVTGLVDLVVPRRCLRCGEPGVALCAECIGPVEPFIAPIDGPMTVAAGPYEDGLRAAVLAYKERGRRDLAVALSGLLGVAVSAVLEQHGEPFVLVPVPSVASVARSRGGQHVLRLARAASAQVGLPVAPDALRLRRRTRDSAGLGVDERRRNMAGALSAARPPPGAAEIAALVVDDVVTTGATVAEAAAALQRAGWPVVGAAVIAATPRRFPHRSGRSTPEISARPHLAGSERAV